MIELFTIIAHPASASRAMASANARDAANRINSTPNAVPPISMSLPRRLIRPDVSATPSAPITAPTPMDDVSAP